LSREEDILQNQILSLKFMARYSKIIIGCKILDTRFALLISIAFAAVMMISLFFNRLYSDVNWDGVLYISAAKQIANAENVHTLIKFPAYPWIIYLFYWLVPDWVISARLISIFSILLVIIAIYCLTANLFSHREAFFASIVVVLFPETLLQSFSVNRDPCFVAALMWSVYFCHKSLLSGKYLDFMAGFCLIIISLLFRIEIFIIYCVYTCFLLLSLVKGPSKGRVKLLIFFLLWISIPFGIFILMLSLTKSDLHYSAVFNRLASAIMTDLNPQIFIDNYNWINSSLQRMSAQTLHGEVGIHFAGIAQRLIFAIYFLGIVHILSKIIIIPNVFSFLYAIWCSRWKNAGAFYLLSISAYFAFIYVYFVWYDIMLARWAYPLAVMICPLIGVGINEFLNSLKRHTYSKVYSLCFLSLIAAFAYAEFDKYFKNNDNLATTAGDWISGQSIFDDATIVFNHPVVAFYSGRDVYSNTKNSILYPNSNDRTFSDIDHFASNHQAKFVILFVRNSSINKIVQFSRFKRIKEFSDEHHTVLLFSIT
jgi:hypothetical protein